MRYVDKNLMGGERVVYRARLHRIIFLWPVVVTVLAVAGMLVAGPYSLALLAVAVLLAVRPWVRYSSTEFAITDKRLMAKVGFISRKTFDLLLTKVESIQVDQTVLGRLFDFGSVVVVGTGGSQDPIHMIAAPLELRKHAQEQISAVQERLGMRRERE